VFIRNAVRALRGAGYTAFDGAPPAISEQSAVAAPYAHVTAPLRRLADRYATEVCLALHVGTAVPDWAAAALPELPPVMAASGRRASDLDRQCTGAVSVFLLTGREGDQFEATVLQVDTDRNRATVLLLEPPVRAHCSADGLVEGSRAVVRLVSVDPGNSAFVVEPVGHPLSDGPVRLVAG
jgi:exoribonuclease R